MPNFSDVKDDAKERFSADLDQLKAGFSQLKSDVSTILHNALGAGRQQARAGTETVRGQANAAVDRVKDGYHDLKDRGNAQLDSLTDTIGERPVTSALIAFGVGFLIAKVLTRR